MLSVACRSIDSLGTSSMSVETGAPLFQTPMKVAFGRLQRDALHGKGDGFELQITD